MITCSGSNGFRTNTAVTEATVRQIIREDPSRKRDGLANNAKGANVHVVVDPVKGEKWARQPSRTSNNVPVWPLLEASTVVVPTPSCNHQWANGGGIELTMIDTVASLLPPDPTE